MIPWETQQDHKVVTLWKERRVTPAGTAEVAAYVVPTSDLGWVDFTYIPRGEVGPKNKRLVADWAGQSMAASTRQVIALADDWFRLLRDWRASVTSGATREA